MHSADASTQVMSDCKVALNCAKLLLNDELVEASLSDSPCYGRSCT